MYHDSDQGQCEIEKEYLLDISPEFVGMSTRGDSPIEEHFSSLEVSPQRLQASNRAAPVAKKQRKPEEVSNQGLMTGLIIGFLAPSKYNRR